MAERIADLLQRGAASHQIRREAVAQNVRSHVRYGRCQAGSGEGILQDNVEHLAALERPIGRPFGHEESA
jgi:hypothetical protein